MKIIAQDLKNIVNLIFGAYECVELNKGYYMNTNLIDSLLKTL